MDINEVIKQPEYNFLRENEHIKDKLIFLTFGGSHAYGTNVEGSDIDVRGCAFNSKTDILGLSNFEQSVNESTDIVIYGFNKFIRLLIDCNPNIIEMLGCKPDHYIFFNDIGKQLVENRGLFLSQKAVSSFGGYANQQLRRLQAAFAHDRLSDEMKAEHLRGAMERAIESFSGRYAAFDKGSIVLNVENADIVADIALEKYPVGEFNGILAELASIHRTYNKLNHRNDKKDAAHLNKHAMHLIRLYHMCFDILEKGEIVTYREEDHDLLMDVRNGKYMKDDETYAPEFFELVNDLEKRLQYDKENTSLPYSPDMKKIEEFVMEVNRKAIGG